LRTGEGEIKTPDGQPPDPCSGGLPAFGSSVVITYTYDPLRRLTNVYYDSGACFLYDYDAGSNITWAREVITSSRVTTYTYNLASQLYRSKVDVEPTTWYYAYDNNGNLREMTPNGSSPANGAIRYTYDAANQLTKVETHNGSSYIKIAEPAYDGEGNRLRLVTWTGSTPLTTTYTYQLVEWTQVLQAKTGISTTTYLYGINPIGEFGTQSVYYLTDGAGSVRQLADPNGYVVLSRWYEPFGQVLTQKGTAVATYGYLGTPLDRVTGLVYINGRYYDPATGRYLTPGGGANPYLPLQISGALLGPLAVLSAAAQRNRKRRRWMQFLAVALVLLAAGGMFTSCNPPTPEPPPTQPPTGTHTKTSGPGTPTPPSTPTTPTPRPLPTTPPPCHLHQ
jgi:RHS repeat-associated protein